MPEGFKRVSNCPKCSTKVSFPSDYFGRVRCPNCSFIWDPLNNSNLYIRKPKRNFAMSMRDTIDYGISMIPVVVMTLLISGFILWMGFQFILEAPRNEEPELLMCFGFITILFSAIVFVSLTAGIGVRIVAEGLVVGNMFMETKHDDYGSNVVSSTFGNTNVDTPDEKSLKENKMVVEDFQLRDIDG